MFSVHVEQLVEEVMKAFNGEVNDEFEPVNLRAVLTDQYEHSDRAEGV